MTLVLVQRVPISPDGLREILSSLTGGTLNFTQELLAHASAATGDDSRLKQLYGYLSPSLDASGDPMASPLPSPTSAPAPSECPVLRSSCFRRVCGCTPCVPLFATLVCGCGLLALHTAVTAVVCLHCACAERTELLPGLSVLPNMFAKDAAAISKEVNNSRNGRDEDDYGDDSVAEAGGAGAGTEDNAKSELERGDSPLVVTAVALNVFVKLAGACGAVAHCC